MEDYKEPNLVDLMKLVIVAKLIFKDTLSIQIPPNLNRQLMPFFILAGADDVGGISPVSLDYVNPEAPWPEIDKLKDEIGSINYKMVERLAVYDKYIKKEYLNDLVYEKATYLRNKI